MSGGIISAMDGISVANVLKANQGLIARLSDGYQRNNPGTYG